MKKVVAIIAAFMVLIIGFFMIDTIIKKDSKQNQLEKQIYIVIENRTKENKEIVFEGSIKTKKAYLGEVLDELIEQKKLTMQSNNSEFGRYVISFNEIDGSEHSAFWMFESSNNKLCVEVGFCNLGIDSLAIQDQDKFIFFLTNDF